VKLEVSDIFRSHCGKVSSKLRRFSTDKLKVISAIINCRTSVLGGHIRQCTNCGHSEQAYNSCWNRHCPKCQGGKSFSWVSERSKELLQVPYAHVVFTLPKELRGLCYANKKAFYNLMFETSASALQIAAESRHKMKLGFFGILHSWNQELQFHPHIHYAVPICGFKNDGTTVIPKSGSYFLPVKVLSKLYRGRVISELKKLYSTGKLFLPQNLSHLNNPREFEHLMSKSTTTDWVVYSKRSFANSTQVIKYLGSYIHRIAISNNRLLSMDSTTVTFRARHRTKKNKKRVVTLSNEEFINRYLLHLLPKGFRRIRYLGFLANSVRNSSLSKLRQVLSSVPLPTIKNTPTTCNHCGKQSLKLIALLKPHRLLSNVSPAFLQPLNSS
jgi:hypothetical protein